MGELVLWLVCFVIVYLLYFLLVINNKKKLAKYRNSTEVKFLENKYKVNIKKIEIKTLANIMALVNAFIIATTVSIIGIVDNMFLKLLVAFVVLIPLILIMYSIIGRLLVKKYGNK